MRVFHVPDYSDKSTARRTIIDAASNKVHSEVLKRNIVNAYGLMFFLQDLGECVKHCFFGDKTPMEVLTAFQTGSLSPTLEEDRKTVLAYIQHMS